MHNFIRGDQNRAKRGKSWALSRWQETKCPNERKKKKKQVTAKSQVVL